MKVIKDGVTLVRSNLPLCHVCICQAEKFQMYVDYCANKPDSNSLLIEHGDNFFEVSTLGFLCYELLCFALKKCYFL